MTIQIPKELLVEMINGLTTFGGEVVKDIVKRATAILNAEYDDKFRQHSIRCQYCGNLGCTCFE